MKLMGKKKLLIACAGSVAAVSLATTAALSAGASETDRGGRETAAAAATPGERLLAIAAKIGPAVPVPAGKVVRLDEQSRSLGTPEGKPGYQANRSVTWAPADQTEVWRQFRQSWTSDDPRPSSEVLKARCGDYYEPRKKQCTLPGDWQKPTPAWLAGLPRDADAMRKWLEQDRSDNGRGDAQSIREITDLFGNPGIPNDVRATIFRAVAKFPGLRAVEAKDLAGHRGIAFGVASDVKWIEFIVDPATGAYLGDRDVLLRDLPADGKKAGDVLTLSSQRESLVDKVGQPAPTPGERLAAIADKIGPAVPVPAGKVSYLDAKAEQLSQDANGKPHIYTERIEIWAPSNQSEVWLMRRQGSSSEVEKSYGRCGDFYTPPKEQCKTAGDWSSPTPDWLAGLPRDGQAMLERIKKDRADNDRNDIQLMVEVTDMLRNPAIPADVRAAVFKALGKVQGLRAVPAIDARGREAVAFGLADEGEWHDMLIDPASGRYLGERQVARKDYPPLGTKAGDVMSQSAFAEVLVDKVGQRP